MNEEFEELLAQWFGAEHKPRRQDDVVVKPTHVFRYHGGYRMLAGQKPRRVKFLPKPPEPYRGAHP